VFEPVPSVDAGLLVVERRARPLVPERAAREYRRFVAGAFRHGRAGARRLEPRHLDPHEWAELFVRRRRLRASAS
jgi:23S rRNA (adenine-N6)-dimethyltransferase